MEEITLCNLFKAQRENIRKELNSVECKADPLAVSKIISNAVEELCSTNGQYRKSLTKMEENVFQSAIGLMNSQQALLSGLCSLHREPCEATVSKPREHKQSEKIDNIKIVGGAVIGGSVGAIFSSWAAVVGAASSAALMLYLNSRNKDENTDEIIDKDKVESFDVDSFLDIVASICQSMDNLLKITREQINSVKASYEQMEKPTLQNSYPLLLENLKELVSISESDENDKNEQILMQIEMIKRSLKNYGIEI